MISDPATVSFAKSQGYPIDETYDIYGKEASSYTTVYVMYNHLDRMDVKLGDVVEKGQSIGKPGDTGMSMGNHLHLELFVETNGYVGGFSRIDPLIIYSFLPGAEIGPGYVAPPPDSDVDVEEAVQVVDRRKEKDANIVLFYGKEII